MRLRNDAGLGRLAALPAEPSTGRWNGANGTRTVTVEVRSGSSTTPAAIRSKP